MMKISQFSQYGQNRQQLKTLDITTYLTWSGTFYKYTHELNLILTLNCRVKDDKLDGLDSYSEKITTELIWSKWIAEATLEALDTST